MQEARAEDDEIRRITNVLNQNHATISSDYAPGFAEPLHTISVGPQFMDREQAEDAVDGCARHRPNIKWSGECAR